MLTVSNYLYEEDVPENQEEPTLKHKIINKAKKVGDQALEIGHTFSSPMFYLGQMTGNKGLMFGSTLLPAVNQFKRQWKAGA